MEKPKKQEGLSREYIAENFPQLNLSKPAETTRKLQALINEMTQVRNFYDDLEEDADPEELEEAYDAYVKKLKEILPTGYVLKEVGTPRKSELWRGTDPLSILGLITDPNNRLEIKADHPNVAHKWETSISYGQPKTPNPAMPFVLAMGFSRPENYNVTRQESSSLYRDTIEAASGEIDFSNVRELVIRFYGKRKGKIFPPKFYLIVPPAEAMAA